MVNAETVSVNKDHVGMTKFISAADDGFQTISGHLGQMVRWAPEKIANNWKQDGPEGVHEADLRPLISEIADPAISSLAKPMPSSGRLFTGRQSYLDGLEAYFVPRVPGPKSRRRFLLYGMGGVGKTQICVRFTENYSHLYVVILCD